MSANLFNSVISAIYPVTTSYTYYVLVGKYCIDAKQFDSVFTLVVFLIYHVLIIYKLIFFMRILVIDDTNTTNRFPNKTASSQSITLKYFNPFIEQEIIDKKMTVLKTCRMCATYKPPRTHHCSICKRCFLKFDHHCSFLGVCIAFHNYKFFYIFICINLIHCVFLIPLIMFELFHNKKLLNSVKTHFIITITLQFIKLIISLNSLVFHTRLILKNETQIENKALNAFMKGDQCVRFIYQEGPILNDQDVFERDENNPYNIGMSENWNQVFGEDPLKWFLPIFTSLGDGINFPKKTG